MSIKLMGIVWDMKMSPGEKLVFLALADQANDDGLQCWPSVATIARRSCQGERTVHRTLKALEDKGFLTIHKRAGMSSQFHLHPCQNGTPAKMAPLPKTTPTLAKMAKDPCQNGTLTINEPLETPIDAKASKRARGKNSKIAIPDWIPKAAWDGWREMRNIKHATPSPRALELAIGALEKLRAKGHDPGDVLDQSTLNGWKGLFPIKDSQNGRLQTDRPSFGRNAPVDGFTAALRQVGNGSPDGYTGGGDDSPAMRQAERIGHQPH